MTHNTILLLAFCLMALVQLFVPAKMIMDRENILAQGKEFKFKTAPIDPNDPFRGKYLSLFYNDNTIKIANVDDWQSGENVYVSLGTDDEGYAFMKAVSKEKPSDQNDYLSVSVAYVSYDSIPALTINYPFDRFYMEESKAKEAEYVQREASLDSNQVSYALVRIQNGKYVLKDVMINDVSIAEIVKGNQNKND